MDMLVEIKLWANGGYVCLCIFVHDLQSHWSIIRWLLLFIPLKLNVFQDLNVACVMTH